MQEDSALLQTRRLYDASGRIQHSACVEAQIFEAKKILAINAQDIEMIISELLKHGKLGQRTLQKSFVRVLIAHACVAYKFQSLFKTNWQPSILVADLKDLSPEKQNIDAYIFDDVEMFNPFQQCLFTHEECASIWCFGVHQNDKAYSGCIFSTLFRTSEEKVIYYAECSSKLRLKVSQPANIPTAKANVSLITPCFPIHWVDHTRLPAFHKDFQSRSALSLTWPRRWNRQSVRFSRVAFDNSLARNPVVLYRELFNQNQNATGSQSPSCLNQAGQHLRAQNSNGNYHQNTQVREEIFYDSTQDTSDIQDAQLGPKTPEVEHGPMNAYPVTAYQQNQQQLQSPLASVPAPRQQDQAQQLYWEHQAAQNSGHLGGLLPQQMVHSTQSFGHSRLSMPRNDQVPMSSLDQPQPMQNQVVPCLIYRGNFYPLGGPVDFAGSVVGMQLG